MNYDAWKLMDPWEAGFYRDPEENCHEDEAIEVRAGDGVVSFLFDIYEERQLGGSVVTLIRVCAEWFVFIRDVGAPMSAAIVYVGPYVCRELAEKHMAAWRPD